MSDCLILNGETFNKINTNNEKTGKWIDYEIDYWSLPYILELASGYDDSTSMDCHWNINGNYVFRPLKYGETEDERITKKEHCDTIKGTIYTNLEIEIVKSKIAPEYYYINCKGSYSRNKKNGVWKYYYDTGEKLKTVNYKDGIPFESFNIYRKDASLMISVIKQNSTWVVSKYSENGKIFEKKPGLIKDFEMLY
jgi:hypothetical protein